ncbi:iron-sulfur cluster biosynthesis family protein [Enterococcus timonensis]|uniref:iron-sulfur cluster biosynthesis family protein n=1 Tax=Enterococcus timonensis TaxID=1852364 RepID=UPI0008DAE3B7|nr:iron-sulfur cluster biosynthesis family protein [Enterococcus timonensis]
MFITVSPKAREKFPQNYQNFLLLANDGSNPYSSAEGCCMIGDRFLLVAISQVPEQYTIEITDKDLHFYFSAYEENFLSGHLVIDVSASGFLVLKNEGGLLDNNLEIKRA